MGVLPLKVIVPITDWKEQYSIAPWLLRLEPSPQNGLSKISAADAFQVRSLSQKRFLRKLGALNEEQMQGLSSALATVLKIDN